MQLTHRPISHKRRADSLLQRCWDTTSATCLSQGGCQTQSWPPIQGLPGCKTHLTKGFIFALPADEPSFTSSGSSKQNLQIMFLEVSGELVTGEGGKLLDWISGATRIIFWREHTPFWILQKRKHKQLRGYPCANTLPYFWLRRISGALAFHLSFARSFTMFV